jgi:hypothetical protein
MIPDGACLSCDRSRKDLSPGGDAPHLYRDGRLMGPIYSVPYARLNADFVRVAVDRDGVACFVAGALDAVTWEATYEVACRMAPARC